MIIKINSRLEMPIYLQLRNQIVKGIGKGELEQGEKMCIRDRPRYVRFTTKEKCP